MNTASPRDQLSAEHPWPGLRAFTEDERGFFFGRERETVELLGLIRRAPVVVLYGQSGLGKTSLLSAGLFPRLRELEFLPLRLRLDYDDVTNLADQLKRALRNELELAKIGSPQPAEDETLWEYFHRRDVDFWGPRNRLLTPVIVFDQFEEIFTLGQRNEEAAARVARFLSELEALIEHRPPAKVRERLEADPDDALKYEFRRESVKLVFSLREDFLAQLDTLRERIPSLLLHRFRLERMSGAQALEVVTRAGQELVDDDVAQDIVEFVSVSERRRDAARALESRSVDPALLSVVCDELNRRRIDRGLEKITSDLLSVERTGIIHDFYERAFSDIDARVRDWVEDKLLTDSGYRHRAALEDAVKSGLPEAAFDQLVDRRVLHREEREGVVWLELTHDLLTDPAAHSRSLREQRRQTEAAAASEAEIRRRLRRSRLLTGTFAALLVAAVATAFVALTMKHRAEQAAAKEIEARRSAERNFQAAAETTERMSFAARGEVWVPTASISKIINEADNSYTRLFTQEAPTDALKLRHAQFLTRAAESLYQVGHFTQGLEYVERALTLIAELGEREASGDLQQLTLAEAHYARGHGLLITGRFTLAHQDLEKAVQLTAASSGAESGLAMLRVQLLSLIDLGELAIKSYALATANDYFDKVLGLIQKSGLTQDEVLFWKVLALSGKGLCQYQINDQQAERWFAEAKKLLEALIARHPTNLRWQRLLADLASKQGFAALNLERLEDAKRSFDQSMRAAEGLYRRDADNLHWRLGLVQSQRGLGLVHQKRFEWELSQRVLESAERAAKELSAAQPSWIQSRYIVAALTFALADLVRLKYPDTPTKDQKPEDLEPAIKKYADVEEWLKKSLQVAPKSAEFVRTVALAIGYQGFIRSQQNKNKEALDLYEKALAALRPIEDLAKDNLLLMRDRAWYHHGVGNALSNLKKPSEAIASYNRAVTILADLVNKTKTPSAYELLSHVQSSIGDRYRDSKETAKAIAHYNLGLEAISRALKIEPKKLQFLNQQAFIHGRVADYRFDQADFAASYNALENAIVTTWNALGHDYSDKSLNESLLFYRNRAERLQSAVKNGVSDTASPQQKLSADQARALLQKIQSLLEKSRPDQLLAQYEPQNWVMQPLTPGNWRKLAPAEVKTAIERLKVALQRAPAELRALRLDQIQGFRRVPIDFYEDAMLYEVAIRQLNGQQGILTYVQRGTKIVFLDGKSDPIHSMNRETPPRLDTAERAEAYLHFFTRALQAEEGRFIVADPSTDILWDPNAATDERAKIAGRIEPLALEASSDGGWRGIGTVLYSKAFYRAAFKLSRFGFVYMFQDSPIAANLPVLVDHFANGVRVLQSEAERFESVRRQIKRIANDGAALEKLARRLAQRKRWKEAVEAQRSVIQWSMRNIKDEAARRKELSGDYLNLSWYQILARDFAGALASIEAGLKIDERFLPLDTNRAHALLFLGRTDEAEELYLGHRGKPLQGKTWEQVILDDLAKLEKEGLTHPEFARIRSLLQSN